MRSPVTGEEMSFRIRKQTLVIEGVTVRYTHESWYCPESEEHYTTTKLDNRNIERALIKYNAKVNKELPSYWWSIAIVLVVSLFILLHK